MRTRPSSRLLILDEQGRVLLFKFSFAEGALAGQVFWATVGGALDDGETFEDAAKRELFEETGIEVESVGEHVAEREFVLPMPDGEQVLAQERFFVVWLETAEIIDVHRTEEERAVMTEHKWWRSSELRSTTETVYPDDLGEMLDSLDQ